MPQPCKTDSHVYSDYELTTLTPHAYESHGENIITQEQSAYPVESIGSDREEMV